MKNQYDDIVEQLHKLADWIEKENHLQCHSVPRKAAYIINALDEENVGMKVQLMKGSYTIKERIQMFIGGIMYKWYKLTQKRKNR